MPAPKEGDKGRRGLGQEGGVRIHIVFKARYYSVFLLHQKCHQMVRTRLLLLGVKGVGKWPLSGPTHPRVPA